MASKPSNSDTSENPAGRSALPFEPVKKKSASKQQAKSSPAVPTGKAEEIKGNTASTAAQEKAKAILNAGKRKAAGKHATLSQTAIPDAVSKRMVRRMALFSGIPTALGMSSFVASYWIISHELFELPNVVALLVSSGFFGLGVVGLSYGVLSTSWDENTPGSRLGFSEFKTNFGRMVQAWRSSRRQSKDG